MTDSPPFSSSSSPADAQRHSRLEGHRREHLIVRRATGRDRQIHLAGANPGLWPATERVETAIPADRKIDGIADYFAGQEIKNVSGLLAPIASAVHEYDVAATLTYVRNSEILPCFEE